MEILREHRKQNIKKRPVSAFPMVIYRFGICLVYQIGILMSRVIFDCCGLRRRRGRIMRLRELRRERGITQLKLGLDLNMSQNTISRYETGAHEAGYAELCRIADYFGVTVDYLLERTDKRD